MNRIGYFCLLFLIWNATADCEPNTCTFKPPKVKIVQGVVVDVQNSPIKDTIIRLWSDGYHTKLIFGSKTDEVGRFRLPKVESGSYYLEFQAPEYYDSQVEVKVSRLSSSNSGLLITPSFSSMGCSVRIKKRPLSRNERLPAK